MVASWGQCEDWGEVGSQTYASALDSSSAGHGAHKASWGQTTDGGKGVS